MTTLSYPSGLPTPGSTLNATADPELVNAFNNVLTWANGNIDAVNLTAAAAQSAAMNQSGQTVKGAVNIATSQNTSSTTFTTLATPDQVTGIVLPANGLISVWYQATWQESVSTAARAAVFLGSNEVLGASANAPGTTGVEASIGGTVNKNVPLATMGTGLFSPSGSTGYTGDVTTGQYVGTTGAPGVNYIFAAAGTYTVSVQFKCSSGTVTASNRKLWVQALSFT